MLEKLREYLEPIELSEQQLQDAENVYKCRTHSQDENYVFYKRRKQSLKDYPISAFARDYTSYFKLLIHIGYSSEEAKAVLNKGFNLYLCNDFQDMLIIFDRFGLKEELLTKTLGLRKYKLINYKLLYARFMGISEIDKSKETLPEVYLLYKEAFKNQYGLDDHDLLIKYPFTSEVRESLKKRHEFKNTIRRAKRDSREKLEDKGDMSDKAVAFQKSIGEKK